MITKHAHNYPPMLGPLEELPAGSPEWAERLSHRIKIGVENIEEQGLDRLLPWIEMAFNTKPCPWQVWPVEHPCLTPQRYFKYAAEVACDDLAKLIAAYKGETYSLVRKLRTATAEGERTIADENVHRGKAPDPHYGIMGVGKQGTSSSYLLRRMAHDRPDVLKRYELGEFKSVRAAADAADIPRNDHPTKLIRRAWKNLSDEERKDFLAEISHAGSGFGVAVCKHCDPVRPEHIGPEISDRCPECGAPLFGLLGADSAKKRK